MKKILSTFLAVVILLTQGVPVFALDMASDFLCEMGLKFYHVARYADALSEFRRALLVNPNNETAQAYIRFLDQKGKISAVKPGVSKEVLAREVTAEKYPKSAALKRDAKQEGAPRNLGEQISRRAAALEAMRGIEETRRKKTEEKEKAVVVSLRSAEKKVSTPSAPSVSRKAKTGELPPRRPPQAARQEAVDFAKEVALEKTKPAPVPAAEKKKEAAPAAGKTAPEKKQKAAKKEEISPAVISLEDAVALSVPISLELGRRLVVQGKNIQRFLSTQEELFVVERVSSNEIAVSGKKLGAGYVHVWDSDERKTLSLVSISPKPQGPTVDEAILTEEERAKTFKLRYHLDWSSFMTGRRLYSVEKQGQDSWDHSLYLNGPTPYGKINSALAVSSVGKTTDVTYLTLGLTEGTFLCLKDFTFYVFDFTSGISNLAYSDANLRGYLFKTPIAGGKADYTVFWGQEGGGKYGGLAPGLQKIKESYLSGLHLNLYPAKGQKYRATVYRGWGEDRTTGLRSGGYDVAASYQRKPWDWGYEAAYDTKRMAYLLNSGYSSNKFAFRSELREMDKDFKSSRGQGNKAGELGLLSTLSYTPRESLMVNSRLDIYKDRLFAAPDDKDYWNEDLSAGATYRLDPLTRASLNYGFQNLLGRLSPSRNYSGSLGLSRTFEWRKKFDIYTTYRYGINRHFSSSGLDYKNHKILSGLRMDVVKHVNYFFSAEQGWVDALSGDDSARPYAFETGLDWADRIRESDFYGHARLTFRNEENALSNFSFLSGEDYLEGYGEISFRPTPGFEAFFNTRVRNVWAENPDVNKRIDVNLYAGIRILWDTGLRWDTYGAFDGFIYNDLNLDGVRQAAEPPIAGVNVITGRDKTQVSDKKGYFKFSKVKVGKVVVALDTTTIPSGYVPTTPASQTLSLTRSQKGHVDFGMAVRTEIKGGVFEEVFVAGQKEPRIVGVKNVVLLLEDGSKATTDDYGRFAFPKVAAGKHKVTLDLQSLPTALIPTVPVFKEVEVSEGSSVTHNFPVKRKAK